ncbi:unnamed protein product [Protopolystoma xenopodis]|uniref:Uncharacterized protein n=1 Tax=Protopolystoma xenopodis TaxID=117903 RepID=A0A3S4ZWC1_9PLAT|nr:unnamed protein product [Protopolystoma xenopodis]
MPRPSPRKTGFCSPDDRIFHEGITRLPNEVSIIGNEKIKEQGGQEIERGEDAGGNEDGPEFASNEAEIEGDESACPINSNFEIAVHNKTISPPSVEVNMPRLIWHSESQSPNSARNQLIPHSRDPSILGNVHGKSCSSHLSYSSSSSPSSSSSSASLASSDSDSITTDNDEPGNTERQSSVRVASGHLVSTGGCIINTGQLRCHQRSSRRHRLISPASRSAIRTGLSLCLPDGNVCQRLPSSAGQLTLESLTGDCRLPESRTVGLGRQKIDKTEETRRATSWSQFEAADDDAFLESLYF